MANNENTKHSFRAFLEKFSERKKPNGETTLPFRFQSNLLTKIEINGEVLGWSIFVLDDAQLACPDFLKFSIAYEVLNTILSGDMKRFEKERASDEENADTETYYSTKDLAEEAFQMTYNVCDKWHKELPAFEVPPLNVYSVHGIKNTRRKMEDTQTAITNLNVLLGLKDIPPTQYYGVFDGHGGVDSAEYTARHLHVILAKQKEFKTDLKQALENSVKVLDDVYCQKSKRDNLKSGSTAVAAVIREKTLYFTWIGDSQVVLVRGGKSVELMTPHKPEREDEKKRIEDLGGCVIWYGAWRVNGTLSVSRAIGDAEFKPYVSGDADASREELDGEEDYLCLACDGFWDVFNGQELVKLVSDYVSNGHDKLSLSEFLCNKAKDAGSKDNITVLVVFLRDEITKVKDDSEVEQQAVENEAKSEGQLEALDSKPGEEGPPSEAAEPGATNPKADGDGTCSEAKGSGDKSTNSDLSPMLSS